MSLTLVSALPFSFSFTGAPDGIPLAAYPYGGYNTITWALDIRVKNASLDTEDVTPGGFIFSLPGQMPGSHPVSPDETTLVPSGYGWADITTIETSIGATITVTTTWGAKNLSGDWILDGNFYALVESDIALTVEDLTTDYGGFTVGMNGFDASAVQWDPTPSFSEDPGVDPETPLDPSLYEISFYDYEGSNEWYEEINLLVDGEPSGGGGGAGNVDDSVRHRVWACSLDGHDYVHFRLGDSATLVFDRTTRQWSQYASAGRSNWRAHVGQNWIGMAATTMARGFGTDIVAGDDSTGQLWILDPTSGEDDNQLTGDPESYLRVVVGGLQASGREVVPCGAVTLDLALGAPTP